MKQLINWLRWQWVKNRNCATCRNFHGDCFGTTYFEPKDNFDVCKDWKRDWSMSLRG